MHIIFCLPEAVKLVLLFLMISDVFVSAHSCAEKPARFSPEADALSYKATLPCSSFKEDSCLA